MSELEQMRQRIAELEKVAAQHKRREGALERLAQEVESEGAHLKAVLQQMPAGIIIAEAPSGKLILGNEQIEKIWRHSSASSVGGKQYGKYQGFHSDGRPYTPEEWPLARSIETGEVVVSEEIEFQRGDGSRGVMWVSSTPIQDRDGHITAGVAIFNDVTERKQAEQELRIKDAAIATSIDAIALANLEGNLTYVNDSFLRLWGYDDEKQILGKPVARFWQMSESALDVVEALRDRGSWIGELVATRKDGSLFDVQLSASIVTDEAGKPICEMASFVDITERRRAEKTLQESEDKFRRLAEQSPNMIFINKRGGTVYANNKCETITGYTREEFYSPDFDFLTLVTPEFRDLVKANFNRHMKGEDIPPYEYGLLGKDGKRIEVIIATALIEYEGSAAILGILTDITERKRAEEQYRTLANSSPVGIYIVQDRKFMFVNPQFQKYFGFNEDELLGTDPLQLVHPADREQVKKNAVEMLKGNRPSLYEFRTIAKSDKVIWAMETATSIQYKGKRATLGNFMDITERKQMEEQLIIADRLASIGELASGIAHELNNPLTSIVGFSQLLLDKDVPDDVKEDIKIIYSEAQRTAEVIKNLLTFARKHAQVEQLVNINSIIEKVLELRAYEQRVSNIQVITRFAPDLPEVTADFFQLQQVFLNLIINAEHFMIEAHNKGTLTIITERTGNIVRASFADDGPGIARENLGHLFDPFFTTKEVGKGTGLGLSICHGIITAHGGRIYAESELGEGATFVMELPISDRYLEGE